MGVPSDSARDAATRHAAGRGVPGFVAAHHVAIVTRQFERMRAFYTETLGLPVLGGFPGERIVFLDAGRVAIELIGEDGPSRPVREDGGWNHLALQVEDVDAVHRDLVARGVPFHVPPEGFPAERPLMRIAFFRDPDGAEIELVQPLAERYPPLTGATPAGDGDGA